MKTHRDYLDIIGNTAATTKGWREKRWNCYYFLTYRYLVANMLREADACRGTVLDIGTSHGNWLPFLKAQGFKTVLGVELHPGRAALARSAGYDVVHNCDAANTPLAKASVDVAMSNDVLVHILRLEDKVAVFREVERVLRQDGVFIFNHTMSRAIGAQGYQVVNHCSYMDLGSLIELVGAHTNFRVIDVKPSYFTFAGRPVRLLTELARTALLMMPLGPHLRFYRDHIYARRLGLEESDSVYLCLAKRH